MRRSKWIVGNHYLFLKRDIHKSIRLDSRIYEYIMRVDGSDLADKLENLVIDHAQLTGKAYDLLG